MLQHRLARFGIVGIVATLVHATTLILLKMLLQLGNGPANLLGFVVSFAVSMYGQQRFTFKDRLQGKTLNGLCCYPFYQQLSIMGCFIFLAAAATSEVENLQTTSAPSEGCSSHPTWGSPSRSTAAAATRRLSSG